MILIDTSSWIEQLRKSGDLSVRQRVENLLKTGEAAWCPIVRLELWSGARGRHERKVLLEMDQTLRSLEINGDIWNRAVSITKKTRENGITVPATDVLVYACAAFHRVSLEHNDNHFTMIDALETV